MDHGNSQQKSQLKRKKRDRYFRESEVGENERKSEKNREKMRF
jgi:hypothetical protein